jgi:hypothetical protein
MSHPPAQSHTPRDPQRNYGRIHAAIPRYAAPSDSPNHDERPPRGSRGPSPAAPESGTARGDWRALLALVLAALVAALLAPAAPAAARSRLTDDSFLARGPGGLPLALVIDGGRLEAYACDGISRNAFFAGRARPGRQVLRNRGGDRLALRLGTRTVHATLTLNGEMPLRLRGRKTDGVAILTVNIRPDGVVTGTATGGGALAAHLSRAGLYGGLALPGHDPQPLAEPGFANAALWVDGQPVPHPPERVAETLKGRWRWLLRPGRIVGATTNLFNINTELRISVDTRFGSQDVGF